MKKINYKKIISEARRVIKTEAEALASQLQTLYSPNGGGDNFVKAVESIVESCSPDVGGKLFITGVGKSGLIARKISATFSSLGIPSFYANPTDLAHGDLGMVGCNDVFLVLSYSGESDELKKIIPHLSEISRKVIAMTARPSSYLGISAGIVIKVNPVKEACPYNIVPTSSTTAMLAIGDALALAAASVKGFKKDDFARYHPGGNLGRMMNVKVSSIMRKGRSNPVVKENDTVRKSLEIMSSSKVGAVSIVNSKGKLVGYFTDGDLRRWLLRSLYEGAGGLDIFMKKINQIMTKNPHTVKPSSPAIEAAKILEEYNCDNIPVVDEMNRPIGIVDERDLVSLGLL